MSTHDLAPLAKAPLAAEAVRRIDAIFGAERTINGLPAEQRMAVRQAHVTPMMAELESWMRAARARMSRHAEVGKAMDYMLKRWDTFSRFLDDGRICLGNNAAERALRGVALGRKAWLFAGTDRGGERAAAMYSLMVTATLMACFSYIEGRYKLARLHSGLGYRSPMIYEAERKAALTRP